MLAELLFLVAWKMTRHCREIGSELKEVYPPTELKPFPGKELFIVVQS